MKLNRITQPLLKILDPSVAHLYQQSLEHETLLEIAKQLSETLNLRTVCETVALRLGEMVRHDETLLLELNPEGTGLVALVRHLTGLGTTDEAGWASDCPALLEALHEACPISIANTAGETGAGFAALHRAGIGALVGVPVLSDGAPSALLVLGRREPHAFSKEEAAVAGKIAVLLGYALQNSRRHDQLQQAYARLHEMTRDLDRRDRMARLGLIASGAVRELNSSLTPVLEFAELLLAETARGDLRHLERYLHHIRAAAGDTASAVRRFSMLLNPHGEEGGAVDVNATVRNAVEITKPRWESMALAAGIDIKLRTNFGQLPILHAPCGPLLDAVTDLIFVLVDRLGTRSGVLSFRTRSTGDAALIEAGCTPLGDAAASVGGVLRTEPAGPGGDPLDAVRASVVRMAGTLECETTENGGVQCTIQLPLTLAPDSAAAARASDGVAADPAGTHHEGLRLLVAEDEPLVREALCAALTQMGHAVLSTVDGEEAAARLRPGYFDALLTDRSMPRLNGDKLANFARTVDPELPVILISGFGDMMVAAGEHPAGVSRILGKPISSASLRNALSGITRRADPT